MQRPMQQLLTINQTAEALHVSRTTVYRMLRRGELTSTTIADRQLIPAKLLYSKLRQAYFQQIGALRHYVEQLKQRGA